MQLIIVHFYCKDFESKFIVALSLVVKQVWKFSPYIHFKFLSYYILTLYGLLTQ